MRTCSQPLSALSLESQLAGLRYSKVMVAPSSSFVCTPKPLDTIRNLLCSVKMGFVSLQTEMDERRRVLGSLNFLLPELCQSSTTSRSRPVAPTSNSSLSSKRPRTHPRGEGPQICNCATRMLPPLKLENIPRLSNNVMILGSIRRPLGASW